MFHFSCIGTTEHAGRHGNIENRFNNSNTSRLICIPTFHTINFSTNCRTTEFLNSKVENGPNTYKQQIFDKFTITH